MSTRLSNNPPVDNHKPGANPSSRAGDPDAPREFAERPEDISRAGGCQWLAVPAVADRQIAIPDRYRPRRVDADQRSTAPRSVVIQQISAGPGDGQILAANSGASTISRVNRPLAAT